MYIKINVKNKVAVRQDDVSIVCGNSDYVIQFNFDAEWEPYETKTARFVTDVGYTDVVFSGNEVAVPVITDAISVRVGVYAGNLHTTTPAVIFCRRCITDGSGSPVEPTPDVYAQLMERLNNLGGGSAAAYVLTLSTEEADAQANSDAVTAAIAEHGHVVLKPGKYPVKPGIVIDSGKLDMNGAHFYTVDYKSSTPLIYMKGEAPEICNGELEGSYDLADDEAGYEFFERESLIFPYGVNDAYIHHMELHNNWGYCISTGTETEKATHYVGTATRIVPNNDIDFQTDAIEIPEGYKYVTASGQIGYNRIISTANVYYYFFDEAGSKIRESNSVPKARIAIPNGAKTVKITTRLDNETFLAYNVYFTNYRESLTVSDCKFRNFHSLGLAGFEGPTNIVGCSFIESGKPRSDANGPRRATTGGVDIEDTPCPEFYMANCYSRDCAKLLMFGGYKGVVTNCIGDQIGAYRGWQLDISDCNISNLYTMGSHIQLTVNGVYADGVDIKEANRKDVSGSISTNGFPLNPSLDCFDSFLVKVGNNNVTGGVVSGVLNGKIKSVTAENIRWKGFAPAKDSHVVIDETVIGNRANYYGILKVTGDSYGIESNTAFLPNGYTIHDSTFTIEDLKSGYMTEVELSGAFQNCVFNLTGATYFKNFNGKCSNPIDLTFTNCVINNADNYLFNFVPHAGGTVTFKNCTIADESKLFNGDASSMTINIVTGGEGGVVVDASLSVAGAAADAKAVGDALANVSGGGCGKLELIYEGTLQESVTSWNISTDNGGKSFALSEAVFVLTSVIEGDENIYSSIGTLVNGKTAAHNAEVSAFKTNSPRYYYCRIKMYPGIGPEVYQYVSGANYNWGPTASKMGYKYNNLWEAEAITSLTITGVSGKSIGLAGTTVVVYGVRA